MRNYKIIPRISDASMQTYWIVESDGSVSSSCTESDPDFQTWLAEGNTPLSSEEPDPWKPIRQKRDQLIRDSDWTMIPGATVDQAQWSAYRQILRDLPQTYSNPEDVVWPTTPSTSGPNTIEE